MHLMLNDYGCVPLIVCGSGEVYIMIMAMVYKWGG